MNRPRKFDIKRANRELMRAMNQASALRESLEKLQAMRCEVCETSGDDAALASTLNAALWSIKAASERAFDALNEAEIKS